MASDLILAIIHHLLVFSLFAIFAIQMAMVKPGLTAAGITRLARLDAGYGALSVGVLVVGFSRAVWGLKGWEYYSGYWVFWAKIGAFAVVGLLSIRPTLRFRRWLSASKANASYALPGSEVAAIRPWLHGEGVFLVAILILAAMLARGVAY